MNAGTVVSLNIGLPQAVDYRGQPVYTGIFKQPVDGPVYLARLNFRGDGQGDLKHHGGPDKAVCAYFFEHYAFWEAMYERSFDWGAFGENVTLGGLTEADVCIGDRWRLGETTVEVSQPRKPCFKLAMKHGIPDLAVQVERTGFTGFYFRVLDEGHVAKGDSLACIERHPLGITVREANRIMNEADADKADVRALLNVAGLSESWRQSLLKRLEAR